MKRTAEKWQKCKSFCQPIDTPGIDSIIEIVNKTKALSYLFTQKRSLGLGALGPSAPSWCTFHTSHKSLTTCTAITVRHFSLSWPSSTARFGVFTHTSRLTVTGSCSGPTSQGFSLGWQPSLRIFTKIRYRFITETTETIGEKTHGRKEMDYLVWSNW